MECGYDEEGNAYGSKDAPKDMVKYTKRVTPIRKALYEYKETRSKQSSKRPCRQKRK